MKICSAGNTFPSTGCARPRRSASSVDTSRSRCRRPPAFARSLPTCEHPARGRIPVSPAAPRTDVRLRPTSAELPDQAEFRVRFEPPQSPMPECSRGNWPDHVECWETNLRVDFVMMLNPKRRRLCLLLAIAGGVLGLVVIDLFSTGSWTAPRDLYLVSISGLPTTTRHVILLERSAGKVFVPNRCFPADLVPGSYTTESGVGYFGPLASNGAVSFSASIRRWGEFGLLAQVSDREWQYAWLEASSVDIRSPYFPIQRRTIRIQVRTERFQPASGQFDDIPDLKSIVTEP